MVINSVFLDAIYIAPSAFNFLELWVGNRPCVKSMKYRLIHITERRRGREEEMREATSAANL